MLTNIFGNRLTALHNARCSAPAFGRSRIGAEDATWCVLGAVPEEILGQAATPADAGHFRDVAPTALLEDAAGHYGPQVAQLVDAGGRVLGRGVFSRLDGLQNLYDLGVAGSLCRLGGSKFRTVVKMKVLWSQRCRLRLPLLWLAGFSQSWSGWSVCIRLVGF